MGGSDSKQCKLSCHALDGAFIILCVQVSLDCIRFYKVESVFEFGITFFMKCKKILSVKTVLLFVKSH